MNVLGRLLMELRQQLQTGEKEALRSVTRPDISNFLLLGRTIETVEPREKEAKYLQPSMFG